MRITQVPHGLDDVLGKSAGPRSGGLHASDIYNRLYQRLEPKRYVEGSAPNLTKMAMGLAWEIYLESLLERAGYQAERPEEQMSQEGIAYSPDLVMCNGHARVGEIKLTYMSDQEDISHPKFAKWLNQVMFYCDSLGIPLARFFVLYVNGNYKDRRDPILQAIDVEFTNRELKENRQLLLNTARHEGML